MRRSRSSGRRCPGSTYEGIPTLLPFHLPPMARATKKSSKTTRKKTEEVPRNSINEVIDVHSLRLAAGDLRLPRLLGLVLYAATVLSFLLVGVASSEDGKRDPFTILLFALAFVAVLMIIVDLDRPQQGILTVSQSALADLLGQMTH